MFNRCQYVVNETIRVSGYKDLCKDGLQRLRILCSIADMLKIGALSLIGLAVLSWFVLGPGQQFESDLPPTIRAELGPLKHRPEDHAAAQDQRRGQPQATRISSRQEAPDAPVRDINLRLSR